MTFIVLYNPSARTAYKTHQLPSNRYPLLLPRVSTDTLPSNGHPTVVTRLNRKVFTGLLPSTGHPIVVYSLLRDVFAGPLPSTGCPSIVGHALIGTCLLSHCLAGVICVTIYNLNLHYFLNTQLIFRFQILILILQQF
jgi:hypothetical protein